MALMKLDQDGLPPGEPGVARNTGLEEAEVTLTDMAPGGETLFEILWASDGASRSSLQPTEDSHVWTFTPGPSEGRGNPIRIRLTHTDENGGVTTQVRIFGIPSAAGFVPPAPGERSDPAASLANATDPAVIDRCERNWPTAAFPLGNPFGWSEELLAMVAEVGSFDHLASTLGAAEEPLGFNGQRLTTAGDPEDPQDVATKAYVDNAVGEGGGDEEEVPRYSAYSSNSFDVDSSVDSAWMGISSKLANLQQTDAHHISRSGADFTFLDAGLYVVDAEVAFAVSQTAPLYFALRARRSSVTIAQQMTAETGLNNMGFGRLHALLTLNANDVVRLEYCQSAGAGVGMTPPALDGESGRHSHITFYKIG